MEIKDNKLIIDIPKGMELDTKNTDVSKGVIMLKKKSNITYEEIVHCGLSIDINKIDAIQKLAYIAKFYNGDWKPEWNNRDEDKNYIFYCYTQNEYYVDAVNTNISDIVYFKDKADAQAVIANPNFRPILDAIYKG